MLYHAKDLTFRYHPASPDVLDRVSLSVAEGEVVVLLGPNGAGKTTLLHLMINQLVPQGGQVLLSGKDVRSMKPKEIASLAGFVPQSHEPSFGYSVMDFVLLGRAPKMGIFGRPGELDEALCLDILSSLGLQNLASRSYLELSGGERQQVMIARALAQEPRILIFDEPAAHLDLGNQQRVLQLIRSMADRGMAVLMTSHNPDHALMAADRTALLSRGGKLTEGPTSQVLKEGILAEVYGTDIRIMDVPGIGQRACLPFSRMVEKSN